MSEEKVTTEVEKQYDAEVQAAARYLTKAVKPTGEIGWNEDGKLDVLVRISLADFAKVLANYWIEHTAERIGESQG